MAPMVSTVHEAKAFTDKVRSHGLPVAGMMVEVPAAALRARHMMDIVDFASIGTNDLTQYAMATDRMAGALAELLDPWQPAVLDLIAATGAAAKAADKPAGVCGEAARDPLLALVLVGLGITSLSMAPSGVPAVRFALSRTTLAECEAMAAAATGCPGRRRCTGRRGEAGRPRGAAGPVVGRLSPTADFGSVKENAAGSGIFLHALVFSSGLNGAHYGDDVPHSDVGHADPGADW